MIELKDIKPDEWMAEDDKAEEASWQLVLSSVPKMQEMDEEVQKITKTIFSLGFNLGVKHQAERMKLILEVLKQLAKAKGL